LLRSNPIGKFLGSFAELSAADLGVAATRGSLERAGAPATSTS
jgi:acetyl-CoA acetyltransferase